MCCFVAATKIGRWTRPFGLIFSRASDDSLRMDVYEVFKGSLSLRIEVVPNVLLDIISLRELLQTVCLISASRLTSVSSAFGGITVSTVFMAVFCDF